MIAETTPPNKLLKPNHYSSLQLGSDPVLVWVKTAKPPSTTEFFRNTTSSLKMPTIAAATTVIMHIPKLEAYLNDMDLPVLWD